MQHALTFPDTLNSYLTQIKSFPLLTPEEEFDYSTKYHTENCLESAHKLVTSHLRYVVKIAHGYKSFGFPIMDLIQEGNVGLMMAVKKFDPYREARFAHYSSFWIKRYIQEYILSNWSLVKIGTTEMQRKLFNSLRKVKAKVYTMMGYKDVEMIADELGATVDQVEEMEMRMNDMCYDHTLEESDESYIESLSDDNQSTELLLIELQEQHRFKTKVDHILDELNDRERYIVQNRFMIDKENKLTFKEIAVTLNISSERVRQLEENIIKKLRGIL